VDKTSMGKPARKMDLLSASLMIHFVLQILFNSFKIQKSFSKICLTIFRMYPDFMQIDILDFLSN